MKITYILKKGLQFFPPCMAQVLYLHDLGIDLTVYHGKNSPYIEALLNERKIEHYCIDYSGKSRNRIEAYIRQILYTVKALPVVNSIPSDEIIWFGNCESVLTLRRAAKNRKFVLSVLELYDRESTYGRMLGKIIHDAACVTSCEKHRAEIMRSWYRLKETPVVLPNKPYEYEDQMIGANDFSLPERNDDFVVIYQGALTKDRPLDRIAQALQEIGDNRIEFLVLGDGDGRLKKKIKSIYSNTVFAGYIPSPQHLAVTARAHIGIANYDYSIINNVFCAPNKIFEYARFAVPMLTSDNIGMTETVGAYGAAECVDFNDIEAIKTGIEKIKANYDFYSQNAKKFYESVDYKECVKKVLEKL